MDEDVPVRNKRQQTEPVNINYKKENELKRVIHRQQSFYELVLTQNKNVCYKCLNCNRKDLTGGFVGRYTIVVSHV